MCVCSAVCVSKEVMCVLGGAHSYYAFLIDLGEGQVYILLYLPLSTFVHTDRSSSQLSRRPSETNSISIAGLCVSLMHIMSLFFLYIRSNINNKLTHSQNMNVSTLYSYNQVCSGYICLGWSRPTEVMDFFCSAYGTY